MSNPEGKGGFQKGRSGNPGGMTAEQRKARDELRQALAGDSMKVHAALLRLVESDNPQAVVYAHQVLHGKDPERIDLSVDAENPAEPLTTEQLLALASSAKPSG